MQSDKNYVEFRVMSHYEHHSLPHRDKLFPALGFGGKIAGKVLNVATT